MRYLTFLILFLFTICTSCTTVQHVSKTNVSYQPITTTTVIAPDDEIMTMIAPYKEQLDEEMNEVIGNVAQELTKRKPESTLGNWYTDAMMAGTEKEGYVADFAISNYGGLRIPYLSAGPLTRGEIFELCPFDNLLVIVDIPGDLLDTLLNQIAESEGWPISKGVVMTIKNNQLVSCTIDNLPVSTSRNYKVAMPDYVANGGDNLKMLIPLSRIQTGKLIRDILIEHALETTKNGKEITAAIEGRVIIQK